MPVDPLEPRLIDVGINLRRGDAGVAEQFLHLPQVGAARQEVRRKTVPQGVGADVGARAAPPHVPLDQFPNRLAPQSLAATRQQHPRRVASLLGELRALRGQLLTDCRDRRAAQRRQSVLASLAMCQTISLGEV